MKSGDHQSYYSSSWEVCSQLYGNPSHDRKAPCYLTTLFLNSVSRNWRDRCSATVMNAVMDASWSLPFYNKHTETILNSNHGFSVCCYTEYCLHVVIHLYIYQNSSVQHWIWVTEWTISLLHCEQVTDRMPDLFFWYNLSPPALLSNTQRLTLGHQRKHFHYIGSHPENKRNENKGEIWIEKKIKILEIGNIDLLC